MYNFRYGVSVCYGLETICHTTNRIFFKKNIYTNQKIKGLFKDLVRNCVHNQSTKSVE